MTSGSKRRKKRCPMSREWRRRWEEGFLPYAAALSTLELPPRVEGDPVASFERMKAVWQAMMDARDREHPIDPERLRQLREYLDEN